MQTGVINGNSSAVELKTVNIVYGYNIGTGSSIVSGNLYSLQKKTAYSDSVPTGYKIYGLLGQTSTSNVYNNSQSTNKYNANSIISPVMGSSYESGAPSSISVRATSGYTQQKDKFMERTLKFLCVPDDS